MSETYKIRNFADLLHVPAERREDCVRELLYGLALLELSFGDEAHKFGSEGFAWSDDGDRRIDLVQPGGESFLTLQITEASPSPSDRGSE